MIEAEILRKDGRINAVNVRGHALYGPYGKDIVCAGVSALCQTCAESLNKLTEGKFSIEIDRGDFHIEVLDYGSGDDMVKINVLLDGLVIGLKSIEESYPQHIKVKERRIWHDGSSAFCT
ncbi:MAG: ribosomal-processing cysteine protease Prp [Thermoanaerobacteraceae bacterium]|nr:ribosomal-processing cysteine protease Prp [Thermoanaerobacteraceae bacterium]